MLRAASADAAALRMRNQFTGMRVKTGVRTIFEQKLLGSPFLE
jgi:hypothetical protein